MVGVETDDHGLIPEKFAGIMARWSQDRPDIPKPRVLQVELAPAIHLTFSAPPR
jgi:DNA-binding transcriptional MocR family regulator